MASLLAMAVVNDSTKSITIIDNKGNTLFNGAAGNNSTSGVGMNSKLKYKSQIEATTSSSLLRNIVSTGLYDDAVITLNYELDWNTAVSYTHLDVYKRQVLGSGVDICYPACNIGLFTDIKKTGGVMSEYPAGVKPVSYTHLKVI